jgi:3-isopropylmalate/(R)-2-methylmalate dehydratase small subunit
MDPVRTVTGNAIPLGRSNVDTDQIIPAKHLKRIERTGYGEFAFEAWRRDPDFVTNQPQYQGAPILLAGPNFGSGSSREHAVWALQQMGLGAVIATGFADIFRNNSAKMGLLTIALPQDAIDHLMARALEIPDAQITVDLDAQTVTLADGWSRTFDIDPHIKNCLLNGLDDISLTLEHEDAIDTFERERRPAHAPTTIH